MANGLKIDPHYFYPDNFLSMKKNIQFGDSFQNFCVKIENFLREQSFSRNFNVDFFFHSLFEITREAQNAAAVIEAGEITRIFFAPV